MPEGLAPQRGEALEIVETPLVRATPESLEGYGLLVEDPEGCPIEIVRWPAQGWRPVDPDTGDEGGTVEGVFSFWWQGDVFHGRNDAVKDQYLIGWSCRPESASAERQTAPREQVLIYHANYHPDGGQFFFPQDGRPFVTALALPGDDVKPSDFKTFYVDGGKGLYIHPNIWHEAVFPLAERGSFFDRQGAVHARVSVDFRVEFGCYLSLPLRAPAA